jgi:hypothetical protein
LSALRSDITAWTGKVRCWGDAILAG